MDSSSIVKRNPESSKRHSIPGIQILDTDSVYNDIQAFKPPHPHKLVIIAEDEKSEQKRKTFIKNIYTLELSSVCCLSGFTLTRLKH